jgi:repressor LexA
VRNHELRKAREALGLSQRKLAAYLGTARKTVNSYETGKHRIPQAVALALAHLTASNRVPLLGTVAAGIPIEPFLDAELVEIPAGMIARGETYVLRVKGLSMRDEGIMSGDLVVVQKQVTARNGQTVIALLNNEATIKTYFHKSGKIELHPANDQMKAIVVKATDELRIEGIVTGVLRYCRR